MTIMAGKDKQETIEHMLKTVREELEKPGSYFEFGLTRPWDMDKEASMGVSVVRLAVYNTIPVVDLNESDVIPEEVAEYVCSGG